MSAGKFNRSRYMADNGTDIYPVRVQPETLALTLGGTANAAPAGAATEKISARISGGRRTLGMNCRRARIQFTAAPPDGYAVDKILTVPILTPTLYQSISKGTTGTYLGVACEVVGKTPEYVN